MAIATVPIDLILVEQRLRELSEAQVEGLVSSILDIGLLNPITVYSRQLIRGGSSVSGFGLVAGAHRLEACKRLGLVDIDVSIVSLSDLERQIAECDENLCGSVLSKAERAIFTKRRKDAYEALHPETKADAPKGNQHASRQVGDEQIASRFTVDTAIKTGQSERAVQRDAERGAKIGTAALALVKGSKLDNGKYLDDLKKIDADKQVAKVKADIQAQKNGMSRRFASKAAPDPLHDGDVHEKQVAALMAAWNKASKEAREDFWSRIDTPVFDRSAA